jgi:hypothetical protein
MDRALARCVPARFDNATIFAFDGTRVIPDLCLLMPAPIQSELVRGLSSLRTETGVDLERDVLGNFGPSVLFATSSLQECLSWLRRWRSSSPARWATAVGPSAR